MIYKTACLTASIAVLAACSNDAPASDVGTQNDAEMSLDLPHSLKDKPLGLELNAAYEDLTTDVSAPALEPVDLQPILEALPENLSVTWVEQTFDDTSGATTWQGFSATVTIADQPLSFVADSLSVWGFDSDLLGSRLRGDRLDEAALLSQRLSAQQFRIEGAAALTEQLFTAWVTDLPDADEFEDLDFSFGRMDIRQEELVIDGLSLKPWEYVPVTSEMLPAELTEEEGFLEVALPLVQSGQWWIALTRSLAMDAILATNSRADVDYNMVGSDVTTVYETDLSLAIGVDGFNLRASLVEDVTYVQGATFDSLVDEQSSFEPTSARMLEDFNFERTDSFSFGLVSDIRLDKLMGYFARAEIPSLEERDLMSLGNWHYEDINSIWFGEELISVKHAHLSLDSFVSYIPTSLDFRFEGLTLDLGNAVGLGMRFGDYYAAERKDGAKLDEDEISEAEAFIAALRVAERKLPEFGFDRLTLDYGLSADWSPDTGALSASSGGSAVAIGEELLNIDLTVPTYEQIVETFKSEPTSSAFDQALEESFSFVGFRYVLTDLGGFDRAFAMAQSIGAEYPDEGWGAMLANMDTAQMRTTLSTFVRLAKSEARTEFPPAVAWIESVAEFVETSGGALEISVQPSEPLTSESFDDPGFEEEDPDWIVSRLGISVTHTPE
ncbi:MAG: hypothetical protein AAFO63_11440 [Pseudomonadota bacterium]